MLVEMREYVDIGLFGADKVLSISWLSQAGDRMSQHDPGASLSFVDLLVLGVTELLLSLF